MTIEELFRKYLDDDMTAEELRLFRELAAHKENRAELDRLLAAWVEKEFPFQHPEEMDIDALYQELTSSKDIPIANSAPATSLQSRSGRRTLFLSAFAVAAACLVVVAGIFLFDRPVPKPEQIAAKAQLSQPVIVPAGNKAILTLADGSRIVLDSVSDGKLTDQGNTRVVKLAGGQLAYQVEKAGPSRSFGPSGKAATPGELSYNEIATPRGGFYQLILPDGSKVWLDAASSLRYPTAFTGKDRSVELTGEAYFEIASNTNQPFLITTRGIMVQVLGTELNLMAYQDEDAIRTTLVSGSLRVVRDNVSKQIRPGQQASWSRGGTAWQLSTPDMREVVAWKQGEFRFQGLPISVIMRQIARWYDVDIEFQGAQPTNEFDGVIPRKKSVTELLTILEQTDEVHFTLRGRKIIVEAGPRP
ncbi:MAG TPA: FecR family protein [Puia sp.]